jgi:hypothetical protein
MTRKVPLLATVAGIALVLGACGLGGLGAAPTSTTQPTVAPSVVPTATRPVAPPSPASAPKPTATPEPAKADTVWVGNTDGQGVYVRKTPQMPDRVRAYPDGTPLTVIGDDVDNDGQQWKQIKTPDGLEGYVPSIYTVDSRP